MIIKGVYGAYLDLDKSRKIYPHKDKKDFWINITWDNGDCDSYQLSESTYINVIKEYEEYLER